VEGVVVIAQDPHVFGHIFMTELEALQIGNCCRRS
jgi:hypothetical protein